MAKPVIMPKFGMDQTESTIVEWLKDEGDEVEKGEPLVVVTTDKVNMEVEAPQDGILAGITAKSDDVVPVTEIIAYILEPGEELPEEADEGSADTPAATDISDASPEESAPSAPPENGRAATPVARRMADSASIDISEIRGTGPAGRVTKDDVERYLEERDSEPVEGAGVRATPAARRVAREHGLNLADITGSGPRGRVQEADALAAVEAAEEAVEAEEAPSPEVDVETVPITGARRIMAQRMQQSNQNIPSFTLNTELDAGPIIELRRKINTRLEETGEGHVSLTALMLKAVAWTLERHRWLNAHCDGKEIQLYSDVHLGVAVARNQGLIVPVIRNAGTKGVADIGAELRDLAERARNDDLSLDELQGATFTVSNLGMFAVDHFTAIINPPQVGILALGRVTRRLVPAEDGTPAARPMLTATLSADHRAVDGALGARFMDDLEAVFAEPGLMLV